MNLNYKLIGGDSEDMVIVKKFKPAVRPRHKARQQNWPIDWSKYSFERLLGK